MCDDSSSDSAPSTQDSETDSDSESGEDGEHEAEEQPGQPSDMAPEPSAQACPSFPDTNVQPQVLSEDAVKTIIFKRARRQAAFNFLWSKIGTRVQIQYKYEGLLVSEKELRAVAVDLHLKIPGEDDMAPHEIPRG